MKQYKLVYDPADDTERFIFSNIDMHGLSDPLAIQREEPIQEEEQEFGKKKSEVIDYEDEEYLALKEREQLPYIVTDSEMRTYSGKLQNVSDSGSVYFAFINMGTYLKVVPISKWYGFVQKNHFADGDVEVLEKNLSNYEFIDDERSGSENEIDYEAVFDDDDGDEHIVEVIKEKKLTTSGKQLQGIVENYEEDEKSKLQPAFEAGEENHEDDENEGAKRVKREAALTKDEIRKIFGKGKISVKDLLKNIKNKFRLDDSEKNMIREFIHESCTFETDQITGEKMFKLKK